MASPAVRVLEHELLVYRRVWRGSVFSSFLSPVLFLAAMGLGLGSLVDASASAGTSTPGANAAALAGVTYLAFLAPGLLASTAMQTAASESTFPIMAGIVWLKSYHGMLATPIGSRSTARKESGISVSKSRLSPVNACASIEPIAGASLKP